MTLPQVAMIQTLDWLHGPTSSVVIISGTNMPVTALRLDEKMQNGIKNSKIGMDWALNA